MERQKSRPDAYGLLKDHSSEIHWCDIAYPAEFKKKYGQVQNQDNYEKVLWSMNWIMQEDARRRFVFGFTISNTTMRLWYASRSEILVSEEFDIMSNYETLVDVLIRLTFATRPQLGFDETMVRCPDMTSRDGSVVYEILVHHKSRDPEKAPKPQWYRTVRLISELGASTIRCRGTRVWEVQALDKPRGNPVGGKTYVLKDTWLDEGRISEGAKLDQLYEQAKGQQYEAPFKDSFMTTRGYSDVMINGRRPDRTDRFKLSRLKSSSAEPTILPLPVGSVPSSENPEKILTTAQGTVRLDTKNGKNGKKVAYTRFPDKIHHRIIFNEVGKPIFQTKSLNDIFSHIGQVFIGLMVLHALNWVHRDISYGNILIVGDQAKITDLEFAMKADDDSEPHTIRTGTIYFMSTEVYRHRYRHTPSRKDDSEGPGLIDMFTKFRGEVNVEDTSGRPEDNEGTSEDEGAADNNRTGEDASPSSSPAIPFRYNPLHDLESVFWLCLFLLLAATFKRDEKLSSSQLAAFSEKQEELYSRIFNDVTERIGIMTEADTFSELNSGLHPLVSKIMAQLDGMRDVLIKAFIAAEATMDPDTPIPFSVGLNTTRKMGGYIKPIMEAIQKYGDLELLVDQDVKPRAPKRQAIKQKKNPAGKTQQLAAIPQEDGEATVDEDAGGDRDGQLPSGRATRSRITKDLGSVRRSARLVEKAASENQVDNSATMPANAPAPKKKKATRGKGRGGKRG
ncbi:hypothetical protein PsYK624_112270 [Phanerochaete sordida]|uniref:Protein kinase domain-containing protein n=1 Tax=Phanerochaete sordida TaxID=48140 RepID=A0A9P3GHK1_9APHY|nr:hypothetical protein PsYK624_112270 [Phanerochaete sordida]